VTSKGDRHMAAPRRDASLDALTRLRRLMRGRDASVPPDATSVGDRTPRAAVALVLRQGPRGLEILLIKRAERMDDPWSGHVALPGGREEPADASLQETALRETLEETGIDLARDGEVLGALDDLRPTTAPNMILVRPYVALLGVDSPLVLSDEVAAAFWVPLDRLSAADAITESVVRVRGVERRVASFRYGEHVVWGMTERILRQLLVALADPTFP
jgi:8-oxo-dGTP pyrophosphatase MutT (NUDIX family)